MNRVFTIELKNGSIWHYDVDLWEIFVGESVISIECTYDNRKDRFDREEIAYLYTDYE